MLKAVVVLVAATVLLRCGRAVDPSKFFSHYPCLESCVDSLEQGFLEVELEGRRGRRRRNSGAGMERF